MRKLFQISIALSVIVLSATQSISAETGPPAGFVLVKGGVFAMGSPPSEFLREQDEISHSVTLRDFYMARHEVTQREYREPSGRSPSEFEGDELPVENVSWLDAVAYCNARSEREGLPPAYTIDGSTVTWNREAGGYRLPTEAEWEYAARAGTVTPFHTGEDVTQAQANYYGNYPYKIERHYFSTDEMAVP
ncbi:formylglycine-generating enzyme family protein, partial [Synergistaceae bacterium OttesenSCG-928-I11]|nr:formylglycine-generating enzyme family protein [Synergistaceae bacterium OttesenSCG-928-I11]